MDVALALLLAIIAVGLLGTWSYALRRGWAYASRDQTQAERRSAVYALAFLMLVPIVLALLEVSDGTANVIIAIAVAVVLTVLTVVGVRDHRRRERRIRARGHGASGTHE